MSQSSKFPRSQYSSPEASGEGAPDEAQKYTKDEVNYRPSGSASTRCGNCAHWTSAAYAGGVCDVVSGDILPDGVSDLWEPAPQSLGDLVV